MTLAPDPLPLAEVRAHLEKASPTDSWRDFLEPFLGQLSPAEGDRIMMLMEESRGEFAKLDYLDVSGSDVAEGDARVLAEYLVPLSEILVDFYDHLKSRTSGYGSLDYQFAEYRPAADCLHPRTGNLDRNLVFF